MIKKAKYHVGIEYEGERGDMPWKPPCPGIQISLAAAAVAVCWLASGGATRTPRASMIDEITQGILLRTHNIHLQVVLAKLTSFTFTPPIGERKIINVPPRPPK